MKITNYNAICNLGFGIDEVYKNAIEGVWDCFELSEDYISGKVVRLGKINSPLPKISDEDYNTRCNRLALACIEPLEIDKYDIISEIIVKKTGVVRKRVGDTDIGKRLKEEICDLEELLKFYESGELKQIK